MSLTAAEPRQRHLLILVACTAVLMGAATGAIVQRVYGVGNLLRSAGIPYPHAPTPEGPRPPEAIEIPEAHRGQLLLFLLAGQSNMVGWAPIPENQPDYPRVYVFGNDYRWQAAREPVDDAYNQVDVVSEDRGAGFGPSLAFAAATLARAPDSAIGLVPCAKSSSAILEWQRDLSDHSLYGSCLKRARAASPAGRLEGVLFFQGETDALDPETHPRFQSRPTEWAQYFAIFVRELRGDLGQPSLPFIFAQIGRHTAPQDLRYWGLIQEQQESISLPMTAMITTDDLALLDGLHFTADSYRAIGKRFADAYWALREAEPPGPTDGGVNTCRPTSGWGTGTAGLGRQ